MASVVYAYLYSRFSRLKQAKGDSARRQQALVEEYLQRNGLVLDDSLDLRDFGVSAFRGQHRKRGALSRFIEGVETGRIAKGSHLMVEELDRLSREPVMDHFDLVNDLLKAGIVLALLDIGWQLTRSELNKVGQSGRIQTLITMMERAHMESVRKSNLIGQARDRERRDEAAGLQKYKRTHPGWLEWDETAQDYVLHPVHAPTIRRVFELAGEGVPQYQIARRLKADGRAPIKGGAYWGTSYISKLLRDDRVLGVRKPNRYVDGEPVPDGEPLLGYYPALATPEEFARAQAQRIVPNHLAGHSKTYANLFSKFCYCGECGSPMWLRSVYKYKAQALKNGKTKRVRKRHPYLICQKKGLGEDVQGGAELPLRQGRSGDPERRAGDRFCPRLVGRRGDREAAPEGGRDRRP